MIAWAGAERFAGGMATGSTRRRARAGRSTKRRKGARRGREGMKLGVIGGGAWGTALAQVAARGGRETMLVGARGRRGRGGQPRSTRTRSFLPGVKLSPAIRATGNLSDLDDCDAWLVVTPAQHMRAVLRRMPCPRQCRSCSARRGSRKARARCCTRSRARCCPTSPIAVLSGPTFAHEVAQGPADRGDPRGEDIGARRAASRPDRPADLPALCLRRRRRRGDRRRGQERARDRLRRGRGQGPRPERARRADRPRLRRDDAASASPVAPSAKRWPACRASATSS